jgi:DNA replication initiation complex subunit (GINS family)
MKKTILTVILVLALSVCLNARENISAEESATVDMLQQLGVVDKQRTEAELNQPLSAIDAMSMEIKGMTVLKTGMIERDKEIIDKLTDRIEDLSIDVAENKKYIDKQKKAIDDFKNGQSDREKLYPIIGFLLFMFGVVAN